MGLLITWVHRSLRGQLDSFDDPKSAYDHLVARYNVTDARAREMAENQFNNTYITRFSSAQDYINAIENAKQDILEAGGYCDDPMMISKMIRGLRGHPMYKDFATQYHLLRDIDAKFEDLDHVITQLLTFESSNIPEPDFRNFAPNGSRYANQNVRTRNATKDWCTICGNWGHSESNCRKAQNNGRSSGNSNNRGPNYSAGNSNGAYNSANSNNRGYNNNNNNSNYSKRDAKPNGMAAPAIVDGKSFAAALKGAKTSAAFPPPEGTTASLPVNQPLAKVFPQTTSLERCLGKGEIDEGGVALEGEEYESACSESGAFVVVRKNSVPHSSIQHGHSQFVLDSKNCFATLDPNTSLEDERTREVEIPQNILTKHLSDMVHADIDDWDITAHESYSYGCSFLDCEEADDMNDAYGLCLGIGNNYIDPNAWILDSGANVYICNNADYFREMYTFDSVISTVSQGSALHIIGGGTVDLELEDGDGDSFTLTLEEVAYAPTSRCNLISVSKLTKAGILGSWGTDDMKLQSPLGFTIGIAMLISGLYHLKLANTARQMRALGAPFVANVDFDDPVWKEHRRLGHLSLSRML